VESLSSTSVWLALAFTGGASALYWTHLLGLRLVVRQLATDVGSGPVVATIERGDTNGWAESAGRGATAAAWAALALLAGALVARWQAVDHAPWSNMYEFTIAFATGILGFYVFFERVYLTGRTSQQADKPASLGASVLGESGTRSARAMGALALPVVFAGLAISLAFFPDDVRPLVPALQNTDLLAIHVAAMIAAYAALSVSFAAGALYLAQGGTANRFARLPKAGVLDDVAYKSVMIGFPVLAAGIALGAYWANSAWGRYWNWDPKETSALVTLLIYGTYLHTHSLRKWAGMRSAIVLVVGFAAVLFTYFVVNLWVSGLHSYAGV
jgi:cytochrome c-type biogenesis protein CcsB